MDVSWVRGVYGPLFEVFPAARPSAPVDREFRPGGGWGASGSVGAVQRLRFVPTPERDEETQERRYEAWWQTDNGAMLRRVDATAARIMCRQSVQGWLAHRAWRLEIGRVGDEEPRSMALTVWWDEGHRHVVPYDHAEAGAFDRALLLAAECLMLHPKGWATPEDLMAIRLAAERFEQFDPSMRNHPLNKRKRASGGE